MIKSKFNFVFNKRSKSKIRSFKYNNAVNDVALRNVSEVFRKRLERIDNRLMNIESNVGKSEWIEVYDKGLKKSYYYHNKTKEIKWKTEDPQLLIIKNEPELKEYFEALEPNDIDDMNEPIRNVESNELIRNVESNDINKPIRNVESNDMNEPIRNVESNEPIKTIEPIINPGRRSLFGIGAAACAICAAFAKNESNKPLKSGTWNYENEGPLVWNKNGVCIPNSIQSPINIITNDTTKSITEEIVFNFGEGDRGGSSVVNTGHGTMQVNFEEGKYTTIINNRVLDLVQFHFHTPSEHAIDGKHTSMEVHLVHKDSETGQLNVFGSMMDGSGQPNAALQACLDDAPEMQGEIPIVVDPNTLLPHPNKRSYFNYTGSLTTPPCSEDVNWYVFENNIQCSPKQVIGFQRYLQRGNSLSMNARPIQPLNNREIKYGSS
jgi:carbonic anhydrase